LNALTNACNQKTNRDPVLELSEAVVQQTLDGLAKKHMVSDRSAGYGGRVAKYRHRFCNTEFGPLKFSKQELGILCVLLLRGPQTPGELRTRTNRLCEFADSDEVEAALDSLMKREDGPFIARLARAPGERESRYAHLFFGEIAQAPEPRADDPGNDAGESSHGAARYRAEQAHARAETPPDRTGASEAELSRRVAQLEEIVAALKREVDALKADPR
jgi:uncharacterized protein